MICNLCNSCRFDVILSSEYTPPCMTWGSSLANQNYPDTLCDQNEVGRLIADVAKIIPAFFCSRKNLWTFNRNVTGLVLVTGNRQVEE